MVGPRSVRPLECGRWLGLALLLVLGAGCRVPHDSLLPTRSGSSAPAEGELSSGAPRSFLVLGDQVSFVWPALLQDLLDRHAARPAFHRVLNASFEAPGIRAWTDAENAPAFRSLTEDYLGEHPRLLAGAPVPRTALCLVSLAGVGDERGPVKSVNDMVGAELGADELERLARALHAAGVERVAFATPLYVHGAGPEIGLESVAIARLLARGLGFVVAGPDLFNASRRYYPGDVDASGALNEFGLKLVAEEWYRWLAGAEASEEAVEALYARDYDVDAIEAFFARARNLARP